jgi:hypothetical protein
MSVGLLLCDGETGRGYPHHMDWRIDTPRHLYPFGLITNPVDNSPFL